MGSEVEVLTERTNLRSLDEFRKKGAWKVSRSPKRAEGSATWSLKGAHRMESDAEATEGVYILP